MPVDNAIYDHEVWWDETRFLYALRSSLNPARFSYFRSVLVEDLGLDPVGKRALDIGCGGGFLAEEFATLGCLVSGIDPSAESIAQARSHAARSGLQIDYHVAAGEMIPYEDASFDIVYCCDVLEHVDDLQRVISESARVLKSGGVYLFDTINRTFLSKFVMIKLAQEWQWSSFMSPGFHDHERFIRPAELSGLFQQHGLLTRQMTGMGPDANPLKLMRTLRQRKRGTIDFAEFGERLPFKVMKDTSVAYLGYAVKTS